MSSVHQLILQHQDHHWHVASPSQPVAHSSTIRHRWTSTSLFKSLLWQCKLLPIATLETNWMRSSLSMPCSWKRPLKERNRIKTRDCKKSSRSAKSYQRTGLWRPSSSYKCHYTSPLKTSWIFLTTRMWLSNWAISSTWRRSYPSSCKSLRVSIILWIAVVNFAVLI